jgi:glutathione S-transferase
VTIKLYDLAAADEQIRFSPYCWRTKMALLHKGLAFETIPWRFTDKETIAPSGSPRVPVIVDGGKWIADSWTIAEYLDETYPEKPLMDGEAAHGLSRFVNSWCDMAVNRALRPFALLQVVTIAHDKDKGYFRESREAALGMSLEDACGEQAAARAALLDVLAPAEQVLSNMAYLGGASPCYGDYALFGSLKWVHSLSGETPLAEDSALARWFEGLLDLHDGYARQAPTAQAA